MLFRSREQADKLENYVLALGIRGYKKWSEKWVRVYRGMEAEKIQEQMCIRDRNGYHGRIPEKPETHRAD